MLKLLMRWHTARSRTGRLPGIADELTMDVRPRCFDEKY
jgi:hypothetical protein